jgi:hypothetical protein
VVPGDNFLLKQSSSEEERTRTVQVGDELKTYKRGYTFKEYAPWAMKKIPEHLLQSSSHPLLGDYLSDYANR